MISEREAEIAAAMRVRGMTWAAIGDVLAMSPNGVRYAVDRLREGRGTFGRGPVWRHLTLDEMRSAIAAQDAGHSVHTIARHLNRDVTALRRAMERYRAGVSRLAQAERRAA